LLDVPRAIAAAIGFNGDCGDLSGGGRGPRSATFPGSSRLAIFASIHEEDGARALVRVREFKITTEA